MAPPDFVGVGVQKAGTTWWYHLITRHPGVVTRGHPKELHYFSRQRFADSFDIQAASAYASWFPRRPGTISGEWTPGYIRYAVTLDRLRMAAPEAQILVMLRDPIDRYRSGMAMMVPRNYPNADEDARYRGLYASQLAELLERFPRERILVLQYEKCVLNPQRELRRTYEFLGLDNSFVPRLIRRGINISMGKYEVTPPLRRELVELYEPEVTRLTTLFPDLEIDAWPNFRHLA